MPHADKKAGADYCAKAACRLQEAEALSADTKHVARKNRQHGVIEPENRGKTFHDRKPQNDGLRDDVRKPFLRFIQKVAPFCGRHRRGAHEQQGDHDHEKTQAVGVKCAGGTHSGDGNTAEGGTDQSRALP